MSDPRSSARGARGPRLTKENAPVADDPSVPTRTASAPIFEKSAEDLVTRLERDGSESARVMAREARALVELFRGWGERRPADDARISAIRQLFDLNRRAMDYLSRGSVPPSTESRR
jgi:hypothetical protein